MNLPVCRPEDWYRRESLADGVTLIWEPFIDPGVRCNMWHRTKKPHSGEPNEHYRASNETRPRSV